MVIAILVILAAIAIPRFPGFTDKAKIANDNQYAALVGNAIVVLIADGTILTGGVAEIPTDASVTITSGITMKSDLTFATELEKLIPQKALQYYASYAITVDNDGEIISITPGAAQ